MLLQERACTTEVAAELLHVKDASRQQLEQEVQNSSTLADHLAKLTNDLASLTQAKDAYKEALEQVGESQQHFEYHISLKEAIRRSLAPITLSNIWPTHGGDQ